MKVWQGQGSDGDPPNEGPYTIDVLTDPDGIGGRRASIVATVEGVSSETVERIPLEVEGGQYVYVRVTEENGQDNPIGQGEDVLNNDTDDLEADGKRDDLNDSAWTSPIWFESQVFVWSKNSDLYHDPDCWAVSRIGAANRRSGAAPAGKTKHNCHP